ncbi:MAG: hypothetical protein M3317_03260 [Actinomycetota bacterium]|nr:hypothetical protein [Actinomycetota bacterium]
MQRSGEVFRPLRPELYRAFAANRVDVEDYKVGEMLCSLQQAVGKGAGSVPGGSCRGLSGRSARG